MIQTAPVTTSGTYTVSVSSVASSTGGYTLKVTLNAALEFESHGGGGDDTLATAQDLSATAVALPSADRLAVLGHAEGASDFYSFVLASGQSTTILLSLAANVPVSLELWDGASNVLATGGSGASNVSLAIHNFVAPAAGTYYVRVAGTGVTDYSLVVLRGADFDLESNDTIATSEFLGTHTVLGAIGNGAPSPDSDSYSFVVNAGDSRQLATTTPSDGPGEFQNTLDPDLELYDSGGTLVATGVTLADGRNEEIIFTAISSGTMYVRVLAQASTTGLRLTVSPTVPRSLTAASPAHLWIGLKNTDDQGMQFDLKVELSKNGNVVASGQALLTPREREVMTLVVSGLLNKQIGGELGISEITVKAHRGHMMRKMKADSLADLVTMAAKLRPAPAPQG